MAVELRASQAVYKKCIYFEIIFYTLYSYLYIFLNKFDRIFDITLRLAVQSLQFFAHTIFIMNSFQKCIHLTVYKLWSVSLF